MLADIIYFHASSSLVVQHFKSIYTAQSYLCIRLLSSSTANVRRHCHMTPARRLQSRWSYRLLYISYPYPKRAASHYLHPIHDPSECQHQLGRLRRSWSLQCHYQISTKRRTGNTSKRMDFLLYLGEHYKLVRLSMANWYHLI
jgi:hypothetical protein